MKIIPAIDIRGGKCVRLYQGDFSQETVFADDPEEVAVRWQEEGAEMLHVVDLDGAREGRPINTALVARICRAVGVPVQVGGGMRSLDAVAATLDAGASRVVLGTLALEVPDMLHEVVARWESRIAVSLDAREGLLTIHGWQDSSQMEATVAAATLVSQGISCLIYTDIARDGTLEGPNFAGICAIQQAAKQEAEIIASGGVGKLGDLLRLQASGVGGAIVGKALYTGNIELCAAIVALQDAKQNGR